MTELKLKSDTAKRKRLFTAESFSHPAKCHIGMLEWILNQYTQEGEIVLDPMAGSGSILIGTLMGRHIVAVELESKFVKMAEDNLKKLSSQALYLGTKERGQAVILQGDARNLTGILADKIITSPPYGNPRNTSEEYDDKYDLRRPKGVAWGRESFRGRYGKTEGQIGDLPYGSIDKIVTSPTYGDAIGRSSSYYDSIDTKNKERIVEMAKWYGDMSRYSNTEGQIGNLPYGQIDKIITSPPYEGIESRDRSKESWWDEEREKKMSGGSAKIAKGYQPDAIITSPPYEEAMGKKHHSPRADKLAEEKSNPVTYTDKVDAVITSPPYEHSLEKPLKEGQSRGLRGRLAKEFGDRPSTSYVKGGYIDAVGSGSLLKGYSSDNENIGNLKSTDYLSAMFAVYEQCFSVLRNGGLLILITKNFIRDQKEIQLDSDTIQLCEEAGFVLKERHYRRLTQQSFWRTIYHHKFPNAPMLEKEDILIFGKPQQ